MKSILSIACIALFFGCNNSNKITSTNNTGKWINLFDGKTTNGWHTYGQANVGDAWKVADGALYLDTTQRDGWQIKGGGDIVSADEFENFDLKLQWKISKNGNSGIILFVHDDKKKYDYVWNTGPEMQVLDNDGHSDGKIMKHRAGDLYDLITANPEAAKPVGEWNDVEIIANNGKLDFFLNAQHVVSTTLWDDSWKKLVAGSKFKVMPDFGTYKKGHIALQDHGNAVWYRNIMIKKL